MRILFNFSTIALLTFFLIEPKPLERSSQQDINYCNQRYHFCLSFPDTLLPIQLISDNGDGIILYSEDKKVSVTIAGSQDIINKSTWNLYDTFIGEWMADNENAKIINETIESTYYKVSFIDGDKYYWQQLFNKENQYVIYQIIVPKEQTHRLDEIVNNLHITFDM